MLLVRTYVGYHFVHGNVGLVRVHLHVFACCVEKSSDNQSRPSWFEFLHSSRKKKYTVDAVIIISTAYMYTNIVHRIKWDSQRSADC